MTITFWWWFWRMLEFQTHKKEKLLNSQGRSERNSAVINSDCNLHCIHFYHIHFPKVIIFYINGRFCFLLLYCYLTIMVFFKFYWEFLHINFCLLNKSLQRMFFAIFTLTNWKLLQTNYSRCSMGARFFMYTTKV